MVVYVVLLRNNYEDISEEALRVFESPILAEFYYETLKMDLQKQSYPSEYPDIIVKELILAEE